MEALIFAVRWVIECLASLVGSKPQLSYTVLAAERLSRLSLIGNDLDGSAYGRIDGGRVVFVEYREEDVAVRIKEVHKMSVKQLEKEMNAVGLVRVRTVETLPLQHIVIFEKRN